MSSKRRSHSDFNRDQRWSCEQRCVVESSWDVLQSSGWFWKGFARHFIGTMIQVALQSQAVRENILENSSSASSLNHSVNRTSDKDSSSDSAGVWTSVGWRAHQRRSLPTRSKRLRGNSHIERGTSNEGRLQRGTRCKASKRVRHSRSFVWQAVVRTTSPKRYPTNFRAVRSVAIIASPLNGTTKTCFSRIKKGKNILHKKWNKRTEGPASKLDRSVRRRTRIHLE